MSVYAQNHHSDFVVAVAVAVAVQNHTVVDFLLGLRLLSGIIVPRGWAVELPVPDPAGFAALAGRLVVAEFASERS